MSESVACAPATYTVEIENAFYDEMPHPGPGPFKRFSVNGSVATSDAHDPATSITIVVKLPDDSSVTVVSDYPIGNPPSPGQPSPFSWDGDIPGYENVLPRGSAVTIIANRIAQATKAIRIVS